MNPLSSNDILHIWEEGQSQGGIHRALTMLSAAMPSVSYPELLALPIGERDRLLMRLRELTFGPQAQGYDECPNCREGLEFDLNLPEFLNLPEILKQPDHLDEAGILHLAKNDITLQLRRITSDDIVSTAAVGGVDDARRKLLSSCIVGSASADTEVDVDELSEELLLAVEERLSNADPFAEVLLDMDCPSCLHSWQVVFDIASFLWIEIAAQATRLLQEVHLLARVYGWREADILAMSPRRRSYYLDMVR